MAGCGRAWNGEIAFVLELRHGPPVPLGHICHPTPGIVPLFNGDGIVKPLPENAVIGFRLIRWGHLEVLQGPDDSLAGGIEQRLPVGAVIEEEPFVLIPGAKMAPQDRQYPIFRLDLSAQNAPQVGEADEAL